MSKSELLHLIPKLFSVEDKVVSILGKEYFYKGLDIYKGKYSELFGEHVVRLDTRTSIGVANLFPEILLTLINNIKTGCLVNTASFCENLEGIAWIDGKNQFPDLNTHESYYIAMANAIVERTQTITEEVLNPNSFIEGATKTIFVNAYERNPKARAKCIEHYGYKCSVCGFDFKKVYGDIGENFIHVHHEVPLSEIKQKYCVDPIKDLKPLCPNCHAMIHRHKPAIKIEDLMESLE